MLKCKKLKSVHILEFLLFILLIHHVRLATAEVTGMTECEEDTTDSDSNKCKDNSNADLTGGNYCIKGEEIYLSKDEVKNSEGLRRNTTPASCKLIYGGNSLTTASVEIFTPPIGTDKGYSIGEMGTTTSGIIYSCTSEGCKQLVSTYHYFESADSGTTKALYKCDDTGTCTKLKAVSEGTYLTGPNGTATDGTAGTKTYNSAASCTNTAPTDCEAVNTTKLADGTTYIDAATPGNIITYISSGTKFSSSKGSTDEGKAYVDADKRQVITCNSTSCSLSKAIDKDGEAKYYIDATTQSKIITCKYDSNDKGSKCTTPDGETDFAMAYYNSDWPGKVIQCTKDTSGKTSCALIDGATKEIPLVHYIEADEMKKIITCKFESSGVECSLKESKFTSAGYAYIDYINKGNIIGCADNNNDCASTLCSGTNTGVSSKRSDTATTSTTSVVNYFYIDGSDTNSNRIIVCTTADCSLITGIATDSTVDKKYYISSSQSTKIIICDKSSNSGSSGSSSSSSICGLSDHGGNDISPKYYIDGYKTENVLQCKTSACTEEKGSTTSGTAYIDAGSGDDQTSKYKNVIDCSSGTCISINNGNAVAVVTTGSNITPAQNTGFIDASAIDAKYIICSTTECKSDTFPIASADGHAILDGSSKKDGKFKNILIYSNSKFESLAGSSKLPNSIDGFAYIDHGSSPDGSKYLNVITCPNGNCAVSKGSSTDGEGYIDGTDIKKMITCTDTTCSSAVGKGSAKDTYINAVDLSQVINCPNNCTIYQSGAKAGRSEYFPRFIDDATELLNCTLTSGKSKCALVSTTNLKLKVFLNDFNNEKDYTTKKPLIICDKVGKCTPKVPTDDQFKKANALFYPNSDSSNTEPLKNDLIKCVKGEGTDAKVICSITNGSNNDVYLNSNYIVTDNEKPILLCSSENGCVETASNSTDKKLECFVNAGSTNTAVPLKDTLIECKNKKCDVLEAKDGDTYINTINTAQTIQCSTAKGCIAVNSKATASKNEIFLNSSDLNGKPAADVALTSDLIICSNSNSTISCEVKDGVANNIYINSHNVTEIIYCTSKGCKTRESKATTTQPEFFINADPINSSDEKLVNDLIKCKNTGSKISCEIISAKDGDVYMNGNVDNDPTMPLIICTETNGCQTNSSLAAGDKPPAYYVNSGSVLSTKLNDTLIQCQYASSAATCTILPASLNDVYVNYGNNTETFPLIKCVKNGCKVSSSSATEESNEYYLNAGDIDDTALTNDIIECTNLKDVITCEELSKVGLGVYLNSNYAESGDNNQLIQCTNDNGCVGIKTGSSTSKMEYYVNAESVDQTNSIIYCSNKKCEKQTPETVPSYYVGVNEDINGLIECTNSTGPCNLKSAFTSSGYFLNAGSNKAVNQTIICDSIDGCETVKVDLGYYVNVGDETKPIIKCDKEGSECVAEASKACPETEEAKAGNYCYEDGQLRFYPNSNSTYVTASKSDDYYTFATIPANEFPGIKTETNSLFKVSYAYINRFYQGGVVMIDKNGKLVDSLSSDQNDITLYDCNDSTKMCTEKPGCTHNTYMYDSENKKAVFCNNGVLEYASFTGYVVDGNRVSGSNHPYIIQCASNGKCVSIKPKVASYFENSGYDSATNSLIQCQSNNCSTVTAEVGYYVGHEGAGYIKCTSATACTYYPSKSKVKYVNAGSNKSSYAIISCTKNGGCSAAKAKTGFYLTYVSTLLIHCSSSSTCVEYTPTVNYYANADSSESNKSIINCVQNSQVVTCAAEATGDGYYPTSTPNVLIRCKSDTDCKTIVVVTGIFRAAITTSDNSSGGITRRIDEDDEEVAVATEKTRDNNSEDENSVHLSRSSDDAYGIIRCVNGKCQSLSPSEIAAIPICEFNNNKCYITLEYAMTKSATTSISAGNICTNLDRSVFYFATDTVVVKPNVISGVTATYIYTTTNSNCLEVNDSYTDMYFTVGSNIYTLDQGCVNQFYETGYYFINTAKNTLVTGNDIDLYNDENVKLYRCNGSSCSIVDKPESMTYYADINKRILKYNVNSGAYSFAYEKDIVCAFANNKCTPNADLKNQEFCITYKGELVLAKADIKNRETGECYRAPSITSTIYGYSQYLYNMNMFAAQMVDETGYYIVSLSTNTTVVSKNYKTKNNGLIVYGCQLSSCKEYTPEEDVYYYDGRAKTILRYRDGIWNTPSTSGYAYISINPADTYIYRFTKNVDEIKINSIANYGYYYTVDQEMYHCNEDEGSSCTPIKDTGYYFTNTGEVYYCIHDSEGLEATECTKQACVSGQYYYIEDAYYRCESSSTLVPVMSRYCSYNENVIVNFPLALTEEYPDKIKQAMEGVEKNNNSTAIVSRRGKNYLESVSGIFTNCTYNVEETKSTFDLVCVNNYVKVDENTDDIKICSMEQLGYVECVEDEENPEKCNVSAAYMFVKPTLFSILILFISSIYLLF